MLSAGKSKVMVLNGEVGLECEVYLEHESKFKCLGCVLDESGTGGSVCGRKVASGRRVVDIIRSLVNARDLQSECRALHETLLVPFFLYGSETML